MKTIKLIAATLITSIVSGNVYAQTLSPKQYAVLPTEEITVKIAKYKRKDGSYPIPYLTGEKNLKFTPSGKFLYILNDAEKEEGKFFVYNLSEKRIVKTFIIPKTGMFSTGGFAFNPSNIYQLAIKTSKSEIIAIADWSKAPEDIFEKKKGEGVTRIGTEEYVDFDFAGDGKSLYVTGKDLLVANLADGKTTKKKLPIANKFSFFKSFIGDDEALIIYKKDEKSSDKTAQIYHIPSDKIVRSYDITGFFSPPKIFSHSPHILAFYLDGFMLNLKTGDKDVTTKKINSAVASGKDDSATSYPVEGNGYVVNHLYYKSSSSTNFKTGDKYTSTSSQNNLYFFDKNGTKSVKATFPDVNREAPWTDLENLQISPNGKYIVFKHSDINNEKNSKWIIATL